MSVFGTRSLWPDEPAGTDLLSFDAVAHTVADALLDEALDPVALALSGRWGSGKTTVLGLVADELGRRATPPQKVLVIETAPWRYDPATGAKESFIAETLSALAAEISASKTRTDEIKDLLVRLGKRIDWAKALKLAATTSMSLQIPSVDNLLDLVKPKEGDPTQVRGLEAFRDEFAQLIDSKDLEHVKAVVVLVDDLDRCLPETVVETLEAMRLFLAVPKMSFVIAADEERVADAIRTRFRDTGRPQENGEDQRQDPATLYLHKIVQTTIPLPALSLFDTQAYLLLLQLQSMIEPAQLGVLIEQCATVRQQGGSIDDLAGVNGLDLAEAKAFATRLTPLLYEKLRGNPRFIKRFLNDLYVRQAIAARRGIGLDAAVIAKLMTLEVLMKPEFDLLLGWFAENKLRENLQQLEGEAFGAAGRQTETVLPGRSNPENGEEDRPRRSASRGRRDATSPRQTGKFSQVMLRWARLRPSLNDLDLSPYLTLAAAFAGVTLVDDALPERLRDVAANLLAGRVTARSQVTDEHLTGLGDGDVLDLLRHFGQTMRDQPAKQKDAVNAILRLAKLRTSVDRAARDALLMLPVGDLAIATPVQFGSDHPPQVRSVLGHWRDALADGRVKQAVNTALSRVGTA
ncbi:P-loop NTPase fold protein [Streptomyces sp. NPDC056956]|uniref:KAP family P-loop NTPase fold protein n=1 Tax=Streptomyces sp. NPDC056956 TaxID=3345980 RepID=UPI003639EFBD